MRISFYCRGSVHEGLGHLTRTRNVARMLTSKAEVRIAAVGDGVAQNILADCGCEYQVFRDDQEATCWALARHADAMVFDALTLSADSFREARRLPLLVSLSPIFEHLTKVDVVYHRTLMRDPRWVSYNRMPELMCGLRYAVIGEHCRRIPSSVYRRALNSNALSLAVSMGGADAYNRTLLAVKEIGEFDRKLRVWIILGEGYSHSYQELVDAVRASKHEIILAKTNDSMWRILSDCSLIVLAGGVSTYEAAYAGIPSLNLLEEESRYFLIQELVEARACLYAGSLSKSSFTAVSRILDNAYRKRSWLYQMHRQAIKLVDGNGAKRIAADILRRVAR
jgi:spore coat polysaccharide biosynthesis predicted glycosyltransferase SpsG